LVSSKAATVDGYLAELDEHSRVEVSALRELILKNLQPGYQEAMAFGMICYQVPLAISGSTYNKEPLVAVGIASQKHHLSLYLMGVYASKDSAMEFESRWQRSGKKLDMGKACVRFRALAGADLDAIAWAVGLYSPKEFADLYLAARKR
jgi:hypothetical protein